ncbi:MAG: hypothetical protein ISR41_07010 [Puniceicoccaceae bacterium]|nr:hypothetical protein [Puniceicoccaceae bacterium]
MTEYNNYILLSDHIVRERGGLKGYSQAEAVYHIWRSQTAKSPLSESQKPSAPAKRKRVLWSWRKHDAA